MTISDNDIAAMLNEELLARRTKVMFLRNAGATWSKIAEETGVSEATCRKDYSVVCRDINREQPADIIARHRAVIFDIQRANYPKMLKGDKDAAIVILRALDREARLLGLDAPTRILAATSGDEFANEAARLIERINELDPTTLKELERGRAREADIIDVTDTAIPADTGAGRAQRGGLVDGPARGRMAGPGGADADGQQRPQPERGPGLFGSPEPPVGGQDNAGQAVPVEHDDPAASDAQQPQPVQPADDPDDDWSNI